VEFHYEQLKARPNVVAFAAGHECEYRNTFSAAFIDAARLCRACVNVFSEKPRGISTYFLNI